MANSQKGTVTQEITRKTADLARLELTDDEIRNFTSQLSVVLQHVDQIGEANVQGVEPIYHPIDLEMPFREDEVKPFPEGKDGQPKVLESAPDVLMDGFKVPPILG